jgi:hypothetical protein
VLEGPSGFNGKTAYFVGTREIAHFDEDDVLDIRLTRNLIRARRPELRDNPSVTLRNSTSADWIEVTLSSPADEKFAQELLEEAARANR